MDPQRWQKIKELFQGAIARPPGDRVSFIDQMCNGDEELRTEAKRLVEAHEKTDDFIESPAYERAPELLLDEPAGALVGQLIGHYRIESLLGVGGMGVVYLARDERLGRKVALKLLPERLTADEAQLSRFEHEARTASALNHPNILTVHEIGADGGRHFIATEFIEGMTLRSAMARGRINLREVLDIAVQVGSALTAAHKSDVLHRDIKPDNVMLRPDAYVKVLDFGIAKLAEQKEPAHHAEDPRSSPGQTQSGLVLGTVHYMSPEQARGQTVDARTDIWSFGVVLYEMLTGKPPFVGETPSDCIASILKTEPPPLSGLSPGIPVKFQTIVQKALCKNRDERYSTIEEMLAELRNLKSELEARSSSSARSIVSKIKYHKPGALLALAAVILVAATSAHFFYRAAPAPSLNEKSIAVLPFADLSQARDQGYFCDGIQEEVLTRLAKVADLKVISRTSTQLYKGAPKNLGEIAKQLGVANIVEGTVQKADGQVRVHAQLIDARTDAHLWAERYDRELADVFAIQSDIAQQIANQLQAKLSPNEKAAIDERPTKDLVAYDLYLQAKEIERDVSGALPEKLNEKVLLLDQAVARDPAFVPALCLLARAHLEMYWFNLDHTAARLERASTALDAAARLRPEAGEVHLARAIQSYWGKRDYASALAELTLAGRLLPNDADTLQFLAFIERRQGQWNESIHHLEAARAIDPRNAATTGELAFEYVSLRRYADATRTFEEVLAWKPNDFTVQLGRALVDVEAKADLHRLQNVIFGESAKAADAGLLASVRIRLALWQRDYDALEQALSATPGPNTTERGYLTPKEFFTGLIAQGLNNPVKAQTAFIGAREKAAAMVAERPDDAKALIILAEIDARLGRNAEAVREAQKASELLPVIEDAFDGPDILARLAGVLAQVGESRHAIDLLEQVLKMPGAPSLTRPCYGRLEIDEVWAPLLGDPRFEKMVASLAPTKRTAVD